MFLQRKMKLVVGHRYMLQITTFLTHSRQSPFSDSYTPLPTIPLPIYPQPEEWRWKVERWVGESNQQYMYSFWSPLLPTFFPTSCSPLLSHFLRCEDDDHRMSVAYLPLRSFRSEVRDTGDPDQWKQCAGSPPLAASGYWDLRLACVTVPTCEIRVSEVGSLETQLRGVVTTGSPLLLSSPPRAPSRPQQGINWVRSCLEVNRIVPTGSMTGE